ncbi:OPI1 [Sanghuangporus sanghuang]
MSISPSSVSRPPQPSRSVSKRRLSLSELCNPATPPNQSTMPKDAPTPGPSSPSVCDPESDRERQSVSKRLSLDAEDESVMIAVSALGDMRSGAKNSISASSPSSSSDVNCAHFSLSNLTNSQSYVISRIPSRIYAYCTLPHVAPSPAASQGEPTLPEESTASAQFVTRVSGLPIVTTALRAYEQSKASSRVVKYGAEMMESSVRSISKPVINRLPVNQLDEFACRQLDKLGKYGNDRCDRIPSQEYQTETEHGDTRVDGNGEARNQSSAKFSIEDREDGETSEVNASMENNDRNSSPREIANRSRWHSLLYEAGGISAAVSEESMRRLKFCLQWLLYATDHIDGQILVLRNFIVSLNAYAEDGNARPISASHMQTLTNVKRDVVKTIRQVVDVVSKYAGGALPEPARSRVRQFILNLPQRWANTAHKQAQPPSQGHAPGQTKNTHKRHRSGLTSAASTAPNSPLQSPKVMNRGVPPLPGMEDVSLHRHTTARPTAGSATQAAQRIMTLATESLDMLRNVTGIVKESLDRADVWVDRLRVIGIQRRNSDNATDIPADANIPSEIPIGTLETAGSVSSSTTGTFPSFPPSPHSWPVDASSPAAMAAHSLDSLTLNSLSASGSTLHTPRSSTQSLPALAGYDWEYTNRKLQTIRDADEDRVEDDDTINEMAATVLSALRSSTRPTSMDVDVKD